MSLKPPEQRKQKKLMVQAS
ncbi:hypothetical protein ID866_12521 [Astraeus odoratus]|nr:hypothetical protein ID866_12521 [Astraeus odoratus]